MTLLDIERLRSLKANGQNQDAFNLYLQLVAMRQTDAEACLIGGLAAEKFGNLWAAKDALESCLEREPEGEILGKARFVLGIVMRRLGRMHEAIQFLTSFIEGLPDYQGLMAVGFGPALYNRGIALQYMGRLDDSLHDFGKACDEFRKEGLNLYLCMALHNRAWVGAMFGDAILARQAMEEARPLCNTPTLQWHQRLGEAFLAAIDFDPFGKTARSVCQRHGLELCEVIYSHQGDDLPAVVRSQAYWLAGTISLDLGEIEDAYRLGQQAMEHSFEAPVGSRCLYDAADLLRQLHAHRASLKQTGP